MTKNRYHFLYYIGLIFLIFPLSEGVKYHPLYLTIPSLVFAGFYISLIYLKPEKRLFTAILWFYLIAYIFYTTCLIEGSMSWFLFFLSNLLSWKFTDKIKSYRPLSFLLLLFVIICDAMFFQPIFGIRLMMSLSSLFVLVSWWSSLYVQRENKLKEELYQKNRHINMLSAENERNRIGRDLHDTLGHTFAMLTLKSELALKQLDKENFEQVRRQLLDIQASSQASMADVRKLINDLSYRSLNEELSILEEMFKLSGILITIENHLSDNFLDPKLESALVMISRELSTNIIKHAKAKTCQLEIKRTDGCYVVNMTDDGIGFTHLDGQELHSIRERLHTLKGKVEIISQHAPTLVRVSIDERIF